MQQNILFMVWCIENCNASFVQFGSVLRGVQLSTYRTMHHRTALQSCSWTAAARDRSLCFSTWSAAAIIPRNGSRVFVTLNVSIQLEHRHLPQKGIAIPKIRFPASRGQASVSGAQFYEMHYLKWCIRKVSNKIDNCLRQPQSLIIVSGFLRSLQTYRLVTWNHITTGSPY